MDRGRPKKELCLLEKITEGRWREDIIELYKRGASNVEVKAYLAETMGSFSECLWTRWMKDEQEFSETIKRGLMYSNAWWERQSRVNLENPKFNTANWFINMKNRFFWKDKQNVEMEVKDFTINVVPASEKDND